MHSYLASIPLAPSLLGVAILICLGIYIRSSIRTRAQYNKFKHAYSTHPATTTYQNEKQRAPEPDSYPPIAPLSNFNWETTPPIAIRPFKPKYHLTMAISTLNPSELIPMDKTYKERLALRKSLLASHPGVVRALNTSRDTPERNARIREALCEWYAFILGEYLPSRYPSMFRLLPGEKSEEGTVLENSVTGVKACIDPEVVLRSLSIGGKDEDGSLLYLMDILSAYIDEDFLILFPNPSPSTASSDDGIPYTLQLYNTYYPAGFNPREKLGLPLANIHTPVPGYKEKLEKSMDRFFAKLEVGKFVLRANWSIMTPGARLFAAFGGLHDHSPEDFDAKKKGKGVGEGEGEGEGNKEAMEEETMDVEGFDGSDTFLRCERQTLHRLPKSKALVFAFHTYAYPIKDVRDEGLGEVMAVAIDGLKEGNVPGIHAYKRGMYWGEAVKKFLRS